MTNVEQNRVIADTLAAETAKSLALVARRIAQQYPAAEIAPLAAEAQPGASTMGRVEDLIRLVNRLKLD